MLGILKTDFLQLVGLFFNGFSNPLYLDAKPNNVL